MYAIDLPVRYDANISRTRNDGYSNFLSNLEIDDGCVIIIDEPQLIYTYVQNLMERNHSQSSHFQLIATMSQTSEDESIATSYRVGRIQLSIYYVTVIA